MIKLALLSMLAFNACGVRGDPIPPGTPAEIGSGRKAFVERQKFFEEESNAREGVLLDRFEDTEQKKKREK